MAGVEFKVDAVLGDTSKLEQQLKDIRANLSLNIDTSQSVQSIDKVKTHINKMYDGLKSSDIAKRLGVQEFDSLDQKVQQLANDMAEITQQTITTNGKGDITGAVLTYKDQLGNVVQETLKWQTVSRQTTNGVVTENQKLVTTQLKYKDNIEQVNNALQRQQDALNRLGTETGSTLNSNNIKDIESLKTVLGSTNIGWDNNTHSIKQFSQQVDNAGHTITKFTVRHKTIENGVEVWKDTSYAVSSADGKLRQYNQTQQQVLNTQQSLTTMLSSAIERFAVWGIAMKIWTGLGNAVQDGTNYVVDLDTAMTNIRVVTMDTKEATQELLETYNQLGQELGASTTDIAEGAVDWLRQGYSQADTTELVKDSTILSKLALIDNAQATEYLTSALKGYMLEAQDAIGVIDQMVAIDLEAATSASDLAEAMSKTANLADSTGVAMNELFGMIATVSEVTQSSASVVGNSMKTLFSRMSNIAAKLKSGRNVA